MNERQFENVQMTRNDEDSPTKDMSPEEIVRFCRNYLSKVRYPVEEFGLHFAESEKSHTYPPKRQ